MCVPDVHVRLHRTGHPLRTDDIEKGNYTQVYAQRTRSRSRLNSFDLDMLQTDYTLTALQRNTPDTIATHKHTHERVRKSVADKRAYSSVRGL